MQTILNRQASFRAAVPARNLKPPPARGLRELLFGVAAPTDKYRGAATELLQLLTSTNGSGSGRRVQQLLDELVAAEQLPFNEQLLAGGPWLVLYTSGSQQLWKAGWSAGKLVTRQNNAASQDLDPTTKAVINRAEYFNSSLYVSAAGTYEPLDSSATLPKRIRANITSGLVACVA